MKNSLRVFTAMRSMAIIALVAIIGFSACSNGSTGGGGRSGGGGGTNTGGTTDTVINIAAVPGLRVPATGDWPVSSIDGTQYTGTVTWTPAVPEVPFRPSTIYTAKITLSANTGYTLQGVKANFFKVAGATTVTNAANSGVITAVFPATSTPTKPTNITGNLGNYEFSTEEDNITPNYGIAVWSLSGTNLTTAKTPGAKLEFVLSTAPSAWMQFVWAGPDNEIWWKNKPFYDFDSSLISATGVTWNSGTKTLTIPLSASSVNDYSSFITQPSLRLMLHYLGNINNLGMVSAKLVGP
jgi:hypothetical protein